MKKLTLLVLIVLFPYLALAADTESGFFETSCEDDFGECTGEVSYSTEGLGGSVTCVCKGEEDGLFSDNHADLDGEPGSITTQEELDQICISTLNACSKNTDNESNPAPDSDSDKEFSTDTEVSTDIESGSLKTSCEDDFGHCTGSLGYSPEGSGGSVTCLCNTGEDDNSIGIHADLRSGPEGEIPTQEEFDQTCMSTLKKCADEARPNKAQTEDDSVSTNSSDCYIGNVATLKARATFDLILILVLGL
jgi:hypothetical protein